MALTVKVDDISFSDYTTSETTSTTTYVKTIGMRMNIHFTYGRVPGINVEAGSASVGQDIVKITYTKNDDTGEYYVSNVVKSSITDTVQDLIEKANDIAEAYATSLIKEKDAREYAEGVLRTYQTLEGLPQEGSMTGLDMLG